MPTVEYDQAHRLNYDLESRWISLYRWLATLSGRSPESIVVDLGRDGLDAIENFDKERRRSPGADFNELHFLKFPNYVQLANFHQSELAKHGQPPAGWTRTLNRQNQDLIRYRNALHHATRFDQLQPHERRKAVQLFGEQLQNLKDWWPEHPYEPFKPLLEENPYVLALQGLSRDELSSEPLVRGLGFEPVRRPTDLVGAGQATQLATELRDDIHRLYRVGQKRLGAGSVAIFLAYLNEWPERSADRERYRRRLARAITLYGQNDARFLVVMMDGRDEGATAAIEGEEIEIVYPRQRAGRPFGTVRAVIDRLSPTRYHRDLLGELAIAGLTSVKDVAQRWNFAFDVERVTKTFYLEFRDLRDRVAAAFVAQNLGHAAFEGMGVADFNAPQGDATEDQRQFQQHVLAFATRQLSRILFLWFLQQKGWLGSEQLGESKSLLVDLFRRRPEGADSYFRDALVPLFFDAVGTPLNDPAHLKAQDAFTVMLGGLRPVALPFLGGSLFRADADPFERAVFGVDDGQRTIPVSLPDELFDPARDNRERPARGKGGGRHRSVLGMLQSYRFTTQESTPDDLSVDPDPELLGKVFENLYQGDERHDTGAYYTPREVVRYMCRQTLDGYLRDHTGIDQATLDWLRIEAVDWRAAEGRLTLARQRALEEALDELTVIDPAVGSGAFLVGMLQEIVLLRRGIAAARTDSQVGAGSHDVFEWKRHAITRSLHGVDINPTAVEICRLRLWLSLVIDYAPRYLSDITPLPNLELGVLAGDSLVDRMGKEPFEFSLGLAEASPYRTHMETAAAHGRLKDSQELYDSLNTKEDLTTADVRSLRRLADQIRDARLALARADLERAIERAEAQVRKLEQGARPSARASSAVRDELADLRVMESSLSPDAPYMKPFLWPLAFPLMEERRGFDIVVANPPYIRQESLSGTDQKAYEAAFPDVFTGTVDILVPFYARGTQLLRSGGWLAYITSNKYMRAAYGEKLRGFLPRTLQMREVIDFGDLPVFDAAAYPAVVVGQKVAEPNQDDAIAAADLNLPIRKRILEDGRTVNVDGVRNELDGLPGLIAENRAPGFTQALLRPSGWILEDPALIRLFDRLMNEGTPLGEYVNGRMYRGVLTGLNEAFVIDEATKERLIRADPRSAEVIKPWLRGRDIKRWRTEWQGLYVIAVQNSGDRDANNPWANVATEQKARTIFAATYPAIHDHLAQWEARLRPRADQGRFWWELRACAYYGELKLPKLLWPDITPEARFVRDASGHFTDTTIFQAIGVPGSLMLVLNSPVADFLLTNLCPTVRGSSLRLKIQYMTDFPLPTISVEMARSLEKINERAEQGVLIEDLLDIASETYGLTHAERIVVQNWSRRRDFVVQEELSNNTEGQE